MCLMNILCPSFAFFQTGAVDKGLSLSRINYKGQDTLNCSLRLYTERRGPSRLTEGISVGVKG